jgi:transposase
MVGEDAWKEIHRLFREEGVAIAEIARRLDLDRKTVRHWLRQKSWKRYQRARREDTLLEKHERYLRRRASAVGYSARILYQELKKMRGYGGSYETVKRFVRPLRDALALAERATVRFETPPGLQSQIDWGQARVELGSRRQVMHVFVLTLGFSRRSFYEACLGETLAQFLEAHERAFDHFGGHTREHLYDRPRTVCHPSGEGGFVWNITFKHFADFWGFEPRVCRPYRAQTKGKVESGVKYFRRNFLPGREFIDVEDFRDQLTVWTVDIADQRVHGTTHERPIDRFEREKSFLIRTAGHPSFRLEAPLPRIVADDYLVTVDTNRYSVPFSLIGQPVEVFRRHGHLEVIHRGAVVSRHVELAGKHQFCILPEHGPGAIARTARRQRPRAGQASLTGTSFPEVEVRDLSVYDTVSSNGGES